MAIRIPPSLSLKAKVIVPTTDPFHVAGPAFPPATTTTRATGRTPVGGQFDAEAMNALGADVPQAVHSRPTIPGGMVQAGAFRPGGHQPGRPSGRGGQGSVPTDLAAGSQRPYEGPPPATPFVPAPPRTARPTSAEPSLAAYHTQLRQLHQRFNRYVERAAAKAPTLDEVNTARRHVAETRCRSCGVWLMGVRAGTAGTRQRVAAEQEAEAQAEHSRQMAERQPLQRIAQLAREAGGHGYGWHGIGPRMAQIDAERTAMAQAPKQPATSKW